MSDTKKASLAQAQAKAVAIRAAKLKAQQKANANAAANGLPPPFPGSGPGPSLNVQSVTDQGFLARIGSIVPVIGESHPNLAGGLVIIVGVLGARWAYKRFR